MISNFRMMQSCIESMQVATCLQTTYTSQNHCRINKASKVVIKENGGGVKKRYQGVKGVKVFFLGGGEGGGESVKLLFPH